MPLQGNKVRRIEAFALLLVLLWSAGCRKTEPPATPVARLDDRTLTLEEIRGQLDSARGISSAELNEYVRRWINNEILYDEAVRRGLDRSESVRARLEEVHRQLAVNALLDEEVYTNGSTEIRPEEIAEYYQAHNAEFRLTSDIALMSFALFRDRDAANNFRTSVLRGATWKDALEQRLADPKEALTILAHVDSTYRTQNTLLPVELWRVASASTKAEPSFPIRTSEGFYVLIVWKLSRQGQIADLPYVEQEIRSRLVIERRQRLLNDLIENLRAKHSVEILVSPAEDTSALGRGR
jgi:hypothetical protein